MNPRDLKIAGVFMSSNSLETSRILWHCRSHDSHRGGAAFFLKPFILSEAGIFLIK